MSNLKQKYKKEIIPQLAQELGIKNPLALPKLEKVVANVGIGGAKTNPRLTEAAKNSLIAITGQKPILRQAKKAISGFKVREGDEVGLIVTLRGAKMYDFVEKLAHITLPRLRDFRGLDPKSFDQAGNLTIGFKEQIVFPEITTQTAEILHGLEIVMVIKSHSAEASQKLLEKFGFPFKKSGSETLMDATHFGKNDQSSTTRKEQKNG